MEGPVKTIVTFAAGALLASGVAYFAVNRNSPPPTEPVAQVQPAASTEPAPTAMPPATEVKAGITEPDPTTPSKVASSPKPSAAPKEPKKSTSTPATASSSSSSASSAPTTSTSQQTAQTQPPPVSTPVLEPAAPTPPPAPPPPPKREPKSVTIPAGTLLTVRIDQTLDTKKNKAGDTFAASLDQPLVVDGMVIAERGARVEGQVVEADPGGRVKGVAQLQLSLVRLSTSDGQKVKLLTEVFTREAKKEAGKDAAKVGAAAGIGAAIGAIAGGGKGAGLGAIIGGAAGTGGVLATRGDAAQISAETRVSFKLRESISITERLN